MTKHASVNLTEEATVDLYCFASDIKELYDSKGNQRIMLEGLPKRVRSIVEEADPNAKFQMQELMDLFQSVLETVGLTFHRHHNNHVVFSKRDLESLNSFDVSGLRSIKSYINSETSSYGHISKTTEK